MEINDQIKLELLQKAYSQGITLSLSNLPAIHYAENRSCSQSTNLCPLTDQSTTNPPEAGPRMSLRKIHD